MLVPPLQSSPDPISIDSSAYVGNVFEQFEHSLDSAKLALGPGETIRVGLAIPLRRSKLPAGTYTVFVIYYCGRNLSNVISMEKVNAFLLKQGAKVYFGWVKSNEIIVEVRN